MTGRVIIVTGASSGLGYEVARYLCEGGNDVILACRNEEKANRSIEKIKRQNPNALATYMNLDLSNLESIKKFVDDFHATEKKLHVLINNAGMSCNFKDTKKQYLPETNFEMTLGTNHLGPFMLTNLLLEDLKKAGADGGDARIVTVTSSVHDPDTMKRRSKQIRDLVAMDMDNILLSNEGTYNGLQAYKNSKLANVMFTYELARRLEGSGVVANCVCPGFIPNTDLMRNASGAQKFFCRYVLHGMLRFTKMTRSVQQGAQAICNVATDEKFKETMGKYLKDGAEVKSSEESMNEENQKKLWEMSGGLCKMEGYEAIEVPPPPVEEEKVEEKKEEEKKEGENENKTDDAKTEDDKKEDEEKKEGEEKKDEEEKKPEEKDEKEKKDEVIEDKKEEKTEEAKTEEKKE